MSIVKPLYTSNWGDLIGYPLAKLLLPAVAKTGISPNGVTLVSFALFTIGSLSLFISYPYHLIWAAGLIFFGYVGDDIDGQLARYTGKSSVIGGYLDMVLDVLKIFIITTSLGYAVYLQTGEPLYLLLGSAACFFFNFRYYVKLETMFTEINRDHEYLAKSAVRRTEFLASIDQKIESWKGTYLGWIKIFWTRNKLIFAVDEAEFAIFVAIGALTNQLAVALVVITVAQVCIGFLRFYQRGSALVYNRDSLLNPMRK